jgi:hypothetical protein
MKGAGIHMSGGVCVRASAGVGRESKTSTCPYLGAQKRAVRDPMQGAKEGGRSLEFVGEGLKRNRSSIVAKIKAETWAGCHRDG